MSKIIQIRTTIQAIIKSIHNNVYYQIAPDNAVMPYIVFDLPNSVDFGALETFVLDIDVWDNKIDTTELETIINSIDLQLHKKSILLDRIGYGLVGYTETENDGVGIILYRDTRINLVDDDPRIRRRKYIYQVRTY